MPTIADCVLWLKEITRCYNVNISLYGYNFSIFQLLLFPVMIALLVFALRGWLDSRP